MTCNKGISIALRRLGKASNTTILPQCFKVSSSSSQNLVGICLMSNIKNKAVFRSIEYPMYRHSQFHRAKIGRQRSAGFGNTLDQKAAHFFAESRKETTVVDSLKYGEIPISVIYCAKPNRSAEHPTMKPVKLFAQQIHNSSKRDWLVLDLFGGSGTTLIAAEQLDRRARLMELSPEYCDVIAARYKEQFGFGEMAIIRDGKKLFPFGEPED